MGTFWAAPPDPPLSPSRENALATFRRILPILPTRTSGQVAKITVITVQITVITVQHLDEHCLSLSLTDLNVFLHFSPVRPGLTDVTNLKHFSAFVRLLVDALKCSQKASLKHAQFLPRCIKMHLGRDCACSRLLLATL